MVRAKTNQLTVKRTLRWEADGDTDSSGSCPQPCEPPLKRQTRQDSKTHAGSSLKTDNDTTQESSSNSQSDEQPSGSTKRERQSQHLLLASKNPENKAMDENTSANIALQNDIVLESLFRYINWSDLLSSRRVNKQWEYAGAKELRRRKLLIRLSFESPKYGKRGKNVLNKMCWRISKCQTSQFLLSSFQIETTTRDSLGSGGIINILNAVGNHIKNLTLFVDYSSKRMTFQQSSLLTHLEHLFMSQVPNLEFLEIKIEVPYHWELERERQQSLNSSICHQNDKNSLIGSSLLLPKLKTFIVTGSPPLPLEFFANIVNAAVNLNYLGGVFSHYFTALVQYLIAPSGPGDGREDKIHLLKDLRFQFHDEDSYKWHAADFEIVEKFLTKYKSDLKLETSEILFKKPYNGGFSTQIQNVINQVLEHSSETLKKLMIRPLVCFPAIAIPFLPELQEIVFYCGTNLRRLRENYSCHFFPIGLNMSHSFPNVFSLVFLNCSMHALRQFIHGLRIAEPMESVRYIHVKVVEENMCDFQLVTERWYDRPWVPPPTPLPPLPTEFRLLFPNLVSISYDNTAMTM